MGLAYNIFMKTVFVFIFLIFSAACSMQKVESQNPVSANPNLQSKQFVLVELFTSEG